MDVYHIWCDLKPGVRDLEFCQRVDAFLCLQAAGQVAGYRVTRKKLGLGRTWASSTSPSRRPTWPNWTAPSPPPPAAPNRRSLLRRQLVRTPASRSTTSTRCARAAPNGSSCVCRQAKFRP